MPYVSTPTPEMVDRIAKHMWEDCRTWPFRHEYEEKSWEELMKMVKKERVEFPTTGAESSLQATVLVGMTRRRAQIALEAIREPTEAMSEAGALAARAEGAHDCEVPMSDVWRAMSNAALEGRAKPPHRILDRKDQGK